MAKDGSKGQKIGRNRVRGQAKAYRLMGRREANRDKRIKREERRTKALRERWAKRIKKGKPARGAARAKRREHLQVRSAA